MRLLSRELQEQIPPPYSAEGQGDPVVVAKFFTPWASWTWYVLEGGYVDMGADFHFFGLVDGLEEELGYFSLSELEALRGPAGLQVERDLYWEPKPLSQVRRGP